MLKIKAYGDTDCGLVRSKNEDYFCINDGLGLYVVADGLGGLLYGERASRLSVMSLEQCMLEIKSPSESLANGFRYANQQVYEVGIEERMELGMATTMTAGYIHEGILYWAHVGDSGLVLVRDGSMSVVTHDDTVAQEIRDRSPEGKDIVIPTHYEHMLTQCIGKGIDLKIQSGSIELKGGDKVLLYTDGVTKAWGELELLDEVERCKSPKQLVRKVIEEANLRGGVDNVTAVVVFAI